MPVTVEPSYVGELQLTRLTVLAPLPSASRAAPSRAVGTTRDGAATGRPTETVRRGPSDGWAPYGKVRLQPLM